MSEEPKENHTRDLASISDMTEDEHLDHKRMRAKTPPSNITAAVAASPPQFVSFEELVKVTNGLTDMALVHKIVLDQDFSVDQLKPPDNSLHKAVHDMMHKTFWDIFSEQMKEEPPKYEQAISLLQEVKEGLLSLLLPQHTRLKAKIDEVLDVDLIRQQTEKGCVDVVGYGQFVVSIMAKLCAPVRDGKIRELTQTTDIILLFRGVLEMLNLMKRDMADFTIQCMRPHLQQHSVEYEKKKFEDLIDVQRQTGIDGLEFTRAWLTRTVTTESRNGPCVASSQMHAHLLTEAYLDMLDWDDSVGFPETMLLDKDRILTLRDQKTTLVLVGSVLLVIYSTVGSAISDVQNFKQTLKDHISALIESSSSRKDDLLVAIADQVVKDVTGVVRSGLDQQLLEILRGQILELGLRDHRVCKLVATRATEFIRQVATSTTASPAKVPACLSTLKEDLVRIGGQFLRVISYNKAVFMPYYMDILTSLTKKTLV